MNCDWIKANTALYVYDELGDDQRHELERHVERCTGCMAELEELRDFRQTMAALRRPEPSPNLLAASRMRLQEQLEEARQASGWRRFTFDAGAWFVQLKLAPALAIALIMVGFSGGVLTTWRTGGTPNVAGNEQTVAAANEASIAGIRAIMPENGSNKVQIKYDTLMPREAEGSLDDPAIQQLLLYAARNNYNSGVRMDSVDLLARDAADPRVREALVYALRYDKNPGVRLKALEGLRPYVKSDITARDAVLFALLNDDNPGVRTEAINTLRESKADSNVRDALRALAEQEENGYIRQESRRMVSTLPEID